MHCKKPIVIGISFELKKINMLRIIKANPEDLRGFFYDLKVRIVEYGIYIRFIILMSMILRSYIHREEELFAEFRFYIYMLFVFYFIWNIYLFFKFRFDCKKFLADLFIDITFFVDSIVFALFYFLTFNVESDAFLFFALPIVLLSQKKISIDRYEFFKAFFVIVLLLVAVYSVYDIYAVVNGAGIGFGVVLVRHYVSRVIYILFIFVLSRIIYHTIVKIFYSIEKNEKALSDLNRAIEEKDVVLKEKDILINEKDAILNGIGEGVFAIDLYHNVLWVNEKLRKDYNKKNGVDINLKGGKCYALFRDEDKICQNCVSVLAMKKKAPHERSEDWGKTTYHVTAAPIVQNDIVCGAVETLLDITDAERLRKFKDEYNNILKIIECAVDSIILTDKKGSILISNKGASKMLGYKDNELNEMKAQSIYCDEKGNRGYDIALDISQKVDDSFDGTLYNYMTYFKDKNDEAIPVSLSVSSIYDEEGKAGYVGIGRDMRDYNKMKLRLLKEEQIIIIGKVAGFLAHIVKVKVVSLRLNINELYKRAQKSNMNHADIDKFTECISILDEIYRKTKELLAETKSNVLVYNMNRIGVAEFVQKLKKHCMQYVIKINIDFTSMPDVVEKDLKIDIDKIYDLFDILIENSIEATSRNFEVVIYRKNDYCVFECNDDGLGINEGDYDTVFENFKSTKHKICDDDGFDENAGIGLNSARIITTQHYGTIDFDKNKRNGARFFIKLPLQNKGE